MESSQITLDTSHVNALNELKVDFVDLVGSLKQLRKDSPSTVRYFHQYSVIYKVIVSCS